MNKNHIEELLSITNINGRSLRSSLAENLTEPPTLGGMGFSSIEINPV